MSKRKQEIGPVTYGGNLRKFRHDQEKTLEEVSEITGIPRSTIQGIELNRHKPSKRILEALRKFYGDLTHQSPEPQFQDVSWRLKRYQEASELSWSQISHATGMPVGTLYRAEREPDKMTLRTAREIERALGFPVALHKEDARNEEVELITSERARVITEIEKAVPIETLEKIARMIHTAATCGLGEVSFSYEESKDWDYMMTIAHLERSGYVVSSTEEGVKIRW